MANKPTVASLAAEFEELTGRVLDLENKVSELTDAVNDSDRMTMEPTVDRIFDLETQMDKHKKAIRALRQEAKELQNSKDDDEQSSTGKKKKSGLTEEQRKAAGQRLQMGRARKLGLDSVEQLRALKLRPGETPEDEDIERVKAEFPVEDAEDEAEVEAPPKKRPAADSKKKQPAKKRQPKKEEPEDEDDEA